MDNLSVANLSIKFMKKLIVAIGLALVAGIVLVNAQSIMEIGSTNLIAKTTLPSAAAGALMQNAVMENGMIAVRNVGTNRFVVITGMATITLPESAIPQLVALPEGYAASNIYNGRFNRSTNGGYNVTVMFVK